MNYPETPKSYGDLVDWEPFIRRVALRNHYDRSQLEDFVSVIYLEFFQGGYLEIFDPTKSKFSTFFWNFVALRALRDRDKANRYYNRQTGNVLSDEFEEDDYADVLEDDTDHYAEAEEGEYFRDFLEDLRDTTVCEVILQYFESPKGTRILRVERSLYTLATLLLMGYKQIEIAKIYGRSPGTISSMIKDLRRHPAVLQRILEHHQNPRTLFD
jgi:RNA polymerase sigma factor (sigma-70 family)